MEGTVLLVLSVSVLFVILSKLKSLLTQKPKLTLPPSPWTLPVIGNLHQLITSPSIYRALRSLAQKHGALMTIWLGEVPAMVVSSSEASEDVLKKHDITFADRYLNPTLGTLFYNGNDMGMAPYGERWRQLRKICVLELLSNARVRSFRHTREDEVARFLANLATAADTGAAVDLTKMICRYNNDAFVRSSIGSRCKYQDEYLDALSTGLRLTTVLTAADLFPSSRLMQLLGTAPRKALACRNRIQRILEQIIEEKTEAMDRGDEGAAECFVGVLLRLQNDRSIPIELTNETIVAVMFDLFVGASETSSTALNWCMTELVRSPAAMAKAQAEVRDAFKGKKTITEDDVEGLSYLKLVIKETLRLHNPLPLSVPRMCREACKVMGYDVPKGMVVFVNTWAICRDPRYWDNPEEFKPERFQDIDLDYRGTNFEFLPFGAGRRVCPGINLASSNIALALANLLYHFDWKLPVGMEPKDVDVCEAAGLVGIKKTNLILHPVSRSRQAN